MKTKRFLLAAGLVLAMAFTLSCSDSGGGNENNPVNNPPGGSVVNPSDYLSADRQVYLMEEDADHNATKKYEGGDGTVYLRHDNTAYGKIEIGKIKGGKLKLTLPDIKKDYSLLLEEWEFCDEENPWGSCKTAPGHSVSPAGLSYLQGEFETDIPNCDIGLSLVKSGKWQDADASLYYSSVAGSIAGTETDIYRDPLGNEESTKRNFNLSFPEGWNFAYTVRGNNEDTWNVTTNLPAGNTLEWAIECNGSQNPGGGDPNNPGGSFRACYFEYTIDICMDFQQNITQEVCKNVGDSKLGGTPGTLRTSCPGGGLNCPQEGIPVYFYAPAGLTCDMINN